jgi:hypothetical protein
MELLIERSGHRLVILDQKQGFLKKQNLARGDKSKNLMLCEEYSLAIVQSKRRRRRSQLGQLDLSKNSQISNL